MPLFYHKYGVFLLKDRLGLDYQSKKVIGLESNIDLRGIEYL